MATEKIKIRKTIQATIAIENACCSSEVKGDRIWVCIDPKMCKFHDMVNGKKFVVVVPYKNYKIHVVWDPYRPITAKKLKNIKEGNRVMFKYRPSSILRVVDMSGNREWHEIDCSAFDITLDVECLARQDDGLFEDAYNREIEALNKFKNR